MPKNSNDSGYYIEYYQLGGTVKVTAIDPVSGIEVSIVGSPLVTQETLNKLAVRKLEYVLAKKRDILDEDSSSI